MAHYWWVNHKQTVRQEIDGGYLWSPKTEANGARSQFYQNMRRAEPGDLVLSYAEGKVAFIGVISDYAVSAPKPGEFGSIGAYWSADGWLLPVDWELVSTAVTPKQMLEHIAPMLPAKYSPINPKNGNGNQKAYLAEIGEGLFTAIVEGTGWTQTKTMHPRSSAADFIDKVELSLEAAVLDDTALSDTEKERIVKSRKGQGDFRAGVLEIESRCRVTGIDNPALLVASHIKPWRSCTTGTERLDRFNGLMLAPHVDHLFDRGLISFSDGGDIIVSSHLSAADLGRLGLSEVCGRSTGPFAPAQQSYLAFHREEIFLD